MPALVAGNTAVFKPAERHAGDGVALHEDLRGGGPAGRRAEPGVRRRAGRSATPMVAAPGRRRDLVHRLDRGRDSASPARRGALGKRISLEMGGKNAIIVMEDADLELATDAVVWSAFGTTGQRCTAMQPRARPRARPRRAGAAGRGARAGRCKLGDGLRGRHRGRPARQRAPGRDASTAYVKVGAGEGALVAGGEPAREGALSKGSFFQPTVFADVKRERARGGRGDLRPGASPW